VNNQPPKIARLFLFHELQYAIARRTLCRITGQIIPHSDALTHTLRGGAVYLNIKTGKRGGTAGSSPVFPERDAGSSESDAFP
jgi:hypothetical protein